MRKNMDLLGFAAVWVLRCMRCSPYQQDQVDAIAEAPHAKCTCHHLARARLGAGSVRTKRSNDYVESYLATFFDKQP